MKKLLNKKGFTLMEMLIVVAIIVILIAIAVPAFTSNLNKAQKSADDANERNAKAAAVAYTVDNTISTAVYFDADKGIIVDDANKPTEGYGKSKDNAGEIIKITMDGNELKYEWVAP